MSPVTNDHFDGRRFFNPWGAPGQPLWKLPGFLLSPRQSWPSSVAVAPARLPEPPASGVAITFIGHATLLIQTPDGNVLTDPTYSERASPLSFAGPRRVRQPSLAFDDLPAIAVVVVSHNHYDHCDLPTLRRLDRRFAPRFVVPLGNAPLLASAGLRRVEELDWWQDAGTAPLRVTLVPAQHFSSRGPFDRNRALWGSYVIASGDRSVFFAGDTGYGPHFHDIRARCGPPDVALLPIGAYEPRWFMKDVHMNPADAVQAHLDLQARLSIGMHFGTFQLTTEGIDEPLHALAAARADKGLPEARFRTLDFGETALIS